ncbi:NAD-dependent epimerase/dehydratase [Gemmatirosa kalamazoonensis]|uniref:NAD-dependent epimerase/dehydratase n=1 Tax=Gemmatirosa kalamazoonensis TaxID=861299 RepID=W0RBU9_9BACT|nr:NAD-dependent epimerase/dehydratase family protein [Gemmatirosa kalamazoonensis]AHG88579.1 NAD-dependent epimerase/dehydratase [Gemmatirosa kalamazoonensis]
MIAVVTGSSGFIGSRLVDALVWRGWTVRRLARAGTRLAAAPGPEPPPPPGQPAPLGRRETHVVDYARPETLETSPAFDGADVVFHLAAVTKARGDDAFRAANVAPTRALLDALAARAARGLPPPRRFLFVSSQAAAGPALTPERPVTEDDPPQPFEPYGKSKLEAERVVREQRAVPWTIVRPSAVYGPGDTDFLALFRQAAHGVGVYPGSREARLSIVYVDDLVDAVLRAGTMPAAAGHVYFVESEAVSWRDVYKAAASAAHFSLRFELDVPTWVLGVAGRAGDVASRLLRRPTLVSSQKVTLGKPRWWLCDGTRAREELGVVARVSLADGAKRTMRWYRSQGWI